jgi:hypothetical protein
MSLLRFVVNPAPRVTLYVVTALVISFSIFLFFFALFQCVPVSKFWTRIVEVPPPDTCQDPNTVVAVTYAHSAIVMVVDWTLATFPIFIVWNMQISLNTKISLALVLGLGSMYVYSSPPYLPLFFLFSLVSNCLLYQMLIYLTVPVLLPLHDFPTFAFWRV